jgi:hypothetical protein
MTKTRPAPLGATYKPDIHPSRLNTRSDVAPSGARRDLLDPSYKDSAPTEHEPAVEMSKSTDKRKLSNRGLNPWVGSVGALYL